MAHKAKMKKKNKVVPCTDANQRAREHMALIARKLRHEAAMEQKRKEEYQARMEAYQRMMESLNQSGNDVPEEVSIPSVIDVQPVDGENGEITVEASAE